MSTTSETTTLRATQAKLLQSKVYTSIMTILAAIGGARYATVAERDNATEVLKRSTGDMVDYVRELVEMVEDTSK